MPRPISEDKKQDWETKICRQQESGLSINEWCRQNKVTKAAFHLTSFEISVRRFLEKNQMKYILSAWGSGFICNFPELLTMY